MLDLLDLTSCPTMPAPWSSQGPGKCWIWGDYFAVFQEKPLTILETLEAMSKKAIARSGIHYDSAMFVYYRLDRNPHGPSKRPVLVMGVERANLHVAAQKLGVDPGLIGGMGATGDGLGPPMLGLFAASGRRNLGELPQQIDDVEARAVFLSIWKRELGLAGEPESIGSMRTAWGHPKTALPPMDSPKTKGCLSVIIVSLIGLGGSIWAGAILLG